MKIEETTPIPAWVAYAVESGILDWSEVRAILPVVARRERSVWWRTVAISLVLAFLCWIASYPAP